MRKEGMVEEHAVSLWSFRLLCRIQLAYAWQRMSNAQRAYHKFNMPSVEAIWIELRRDATEGWRGGKSREWGG